MHQQTSEARLNLTETLVVKHPVIYSVAFLAWPVRVSQGVLTWSDRSAATDCGHRLGFALS